MDTAERAQQVHDAALAAGFDRCGIADASALAAAPRLRQWLDRGFHGDMAWLERNFERRTNPTTVVPDARTVVVVARNYSAPHAPVTDPHAARISRYAWGEEYHEVLGAAVRGLYARIQELVPGASGRYYVDTGPVMEKAWAELAGIGWIGKHTNVLSTRSGSWFFLAAIILDVELAVDTAARDHCGTCRACIDACPTKAIVAPYVLDATRCISYLTIEHRGPIDAELRPGIGNRIFGCDDCQDVCPWNRFARLVNEGDPFWPRDENVSPALLELFDLDEEGFRQRFRRSPIRRAKYTGFLRNVAIALGNSGDSNAIPALARRLANADVLVRGHCAWALGQLGAHEPLAAAADREGDPWVQDEIQAALAFVAS